MSKLIKDVINKIRKFQPDVRLYSAGRVISANDGILIIEGLDDIRYGELIYIEGDNYAIAVDLLPDRTGAILLTDTESVETDDLAYATGSIVSVPAGESLLGRVINPLGEPVDGRGALNIKEFRQIEYPAPSIIMRAKVNEPLMTGIAAIDSMIPIGKGQRELIIGDRQTGKTTIAIDTIINQKGKDVICVYVAIGQKASNIAKIVHTLNEYGATAYTVVVSSTAKDPAPLQYIAPYTGAAIAEHFMYGGRDTLIVYDDLSKHAVAYRTISLLLKRPPGREAYSGDIFYIHSRLLERASKLSDKAGGGSMTALPIIETLQGDISAYIPTNVISITDGQIYLESDLFNAGIRPAINVGLSVSRVGGSAQTDAMKQVSGKLRLELAHYRELAVFAQFGADLDKSTAYAIRRGSLIEESLKQQQNTPMSLEKQIIRLYAVTSNLIRDIKAHEINEFLDGLLTLITSYYPEILIKLKSGELNDDAKDKINRAIERHLLYFTERGNV
jgi:F-type H+-transporting ATPase subunit alpha